MMATPVLHKAAAVGRDLFAATATTGTSSEAPSEKVGHDEERERLAQVGNHVSAPLPPSEVVKDPAKKELGASSRSLRLSDFELVRTLGTGTFARVWLARFANDGQGDEGTVYALKVLRKTDIIRMKQVEHVRNERAVLAAVAGHPFITTLITTFADNDCLYMLLDYCPGGEVFSYLRKQRRFDIPTTRFYAAEIALILEFLHETQGVAYRDLKPENLLIDSEGHIKLVDFGFAKSVGNDATYTLCGTPEYLAPEVIQSKGHTMAVDWWAFGILIYEFIVGQPPFWDANPMKIYEKIVHEPIRFPRAMHPDAQDLISGLCTVDRSRRLGNLSGGARQVKQHPFFDGIDWETLYYRRMKGPIVPQLRHKADASNFDEYADDDGEKAPYTEDMRREYEEAFREF